MAIVELVGPAGCGKSTLARALAQSDPRIRIDSFPRVREMRNLPFFLWNGCKLLPAWSALYRHKSDKSLTAKQVTTLIILSGWPRMLKAESSVDNRITVLDQGPVYMLAELLRFGPKDFRRITSKWWAEACDEWAKLVDIVISLDASNTILMERVRARDTRHGIKANSNEWAAQFLARSREAQQEVLDSMAGKNGTVRVIPLNTSQSSLDKSVQFILSLLDQQKKPS